MTLRINTARLGRRVAPPVDDDQGAVVRPLRRLRHLAPNDPRRGEINPDYAFIDGAWEPVSPMPPTAEVAAITGAVPETYDHSGTDVTALHAPVDVPVGLDDGWDDYLAGRQDWGPEMNTKVDAELASIDPAEKERDHQARLDRYLTALDPAYAEQLVRRDAARAEVDDAWARAESAATTAIQNRTRKTA